ncbi:MAG TPA: hypothetical protein VFB41_04340 [Solirubrobacteraceae bacterium]|nr:hypothetical protein [Solirubrobacteraceae bacterium]
MARVVAGFNVPHTPYLPVTVPKGDTLNGGLFEQTRELLEASRPDAVVIFDDDHVNTFFLDNLPTFAVGFADAMSGPNDEAPLPTREVPIHADLGRAIYTHGIRSGFDLARTEKLTVDHSIMVPLHFLMPEKLVPVVPFFINCLVPPFPSAGRAHAVGKMVGEAVEAFPEDLRVAVIASGSINHEVAGPRVLPGEIWNAPDPGWLEEVVAWLEAGQVEEIVEHATDERLDAVGNVAHELLTIIAMLGAIGDQPLRIVGKDTRLGHCFTAWSADA